MWPFKSKAVVLAKDHGTVESIMFDHLIISGVRYDCRAPLVENGQQVRKGQPVGKK